MDRRYDRRVYYTLQHAQQYKSKTRPYPFIVAHECHEEYFDRTLNDTRVRTRVFYAFDDVDQFLERRSSFPHSHEVVYNRFSEKQQGRLVFDFDFDKAWFGVKPRFVCDNFESMIEKLVLDTFQRFYSNVDTSKFVFVWLVSDVIDKWSKHLIVKNAFFADDWKIQTQCFYQLMLGMVHENNPFAPDLAAKDLIDSQVARVNATMRMWGSSKMKNGKVLELERPEGISFYDSMIQLYRRQDIQVEQHIYSDQLDKKHLDQMFYDNPQTLMNNVFYKTACDVVHIDVTKAINEYSSVELSDEEIQRAFQAFELYFCKAYNAKEQTCFGIKSVMGSLINLERKYPGVCLLSGKNHDNENAYLTITPDKSVYFYCRRGCHFKGNKGICIRLSEQTTQDTFYV